MRKETKTISYGNKTYRLYRAYPNVEYIDKLAKKLVISKKDIESVKSQLSYCWLDDDYLFTVALNILNMESVKPKSIYQDEIGEMIKVKPSVDEIFHMLLKGIKTYVFSR